MENSGHNFMLKRIQKINEKQNTFKYKLYLVIKRIIDIIGSIFGIIVMIPLMLIIKISYVLIGDYKSIFYIQKRVGKNGKIIKMYKFRTMTDKKDKDGNLLKPINYYNLLLKSGLVCGILFIPMLFLLYPIGNFLNTSFGFANDISNSTLDDLRNKFTFLQ